MHIRARQGAHTWHAGHISRIFTSDDVGSEFTATIRLVTDPQALRPVQRKLRIESLNLAENEVCVVITGHSETEVLHVEQTK